MLFELAFVNFYDGNPFPFQLTVCNNNSVDKSAEVDEFTILCQGGFFYI